MPCEDLMKNSTSFLFLAVVLVCLFATALQAATHAEGIVLEGGRYKIALSPDNGSIERVSEGGSAKTILRSGEQGLWHVRFRDGSTLSAADFHAGSNSRRFQCSRDAKTGTIRLNYVAPEAGVVIDVKGQETGFDFVGQVTPTSKTVLEFVLPARLRFDPEQVRRFISPLHPHLGVGAAFNSRFFKRQPSNKFLKYESPYPPVFADFLHLDSSAGTASLYRIQPRTWKPWAGEEDPKAIFVPGRLALGGDEQGGWCERAFGTWVPAGRTWIAPTVRLALGGSAEHDLLAYCQANAITRTLQQKLPPQLLGTFCRAVLVKYNGSAREKIASLDKLPVPTLIHYADYLQGGFDKQYPDHLPPGPGFGTPEELRALHDRAHQLGHLLMPYTNPTWWCDHPRGPTFERAGEAPLLRTLDDKPSFERYARNDGWTTCLWHPAVRAANRRTLQQFTDDYPTDIFFQDQCGARTWKYDLNAASPTPYAYAEGMLSMVDEDCAAKPLSTEDGWDRVVNAEVQLCGFTFALGPGKGAPQRPEMKMVYHPSTWQLYPLAQRIAHDKAAMLHHDLGKFVTDRPTLAWTLGLGFAMSYAIRAKALDEPAPREWLKWLDRIQKSVCARYVGQPVATFAHEQGGDVPSDDGVIRASYGPVQLAVNLGPTARREAGRELPGYGFCATAPGMVAANLKRLADIDFGDEGVCFVAEGDAKRAEVWFLARAGEEVAAELPGDISGNVVVTFDGQPPQRMITANRAIMLRLPAASAPAAERFDSSAGQPRQLWHAVVTPQGP